MNTCKWCKKEKVNLTHWGICQKCMDRQQDTIRKWNTADRDIELDDSETASNYY